MSENTIALLAGGCIIALSAFMFIRERQAVARRKEARGGKDLDVSDLIAFGAKAATKKD
ncbi:hypothetical protein [Algirhabdus cladophorae]|uniref:hypothetical protein n=1 Tax=Algirhabdus cladophorae TaxID=3377108 RepID=UPI003B846643